MSELKRAKIIVNGSVQGVGYRYFVMRLAQSLDIKGYTKNIFSGEVLTEVEGDSSLIQEFIKQLKIGPSHAYVKNCFVEWEGYKNEFKNFEIRY
jgi:acylphosphatase